MPSLDTIKSQVQAVTNMLNEFGKLNALGITCSYDTLELEKTRVSIKSSLISLNAQMRAHKDYKWDFELLGTGAIQ